MYGGYFWKIHDIEPEIFSHPYKILGYKKVNE